MYANITDYTLILPPIDIWAYQAMEEEHAEHRPPSPPPPPPRPPPSSLDGHNIHEDIGPSLFSPSSVSPQLEETEAHAQQQDQYQHPQPNAAPLLLRRYRRPFSVSHRFALAVYNFGSSGMRDDVCSCLLILAVFCFFASMTLILGFYGSLELQLGPNSSYLLEASPILVQSIEAEQVGNKSAGPMLYGFHKSPSRDVETTWSRKHTASVEPYYHAEWAYYLNAGSQVEISYEVQVPTSAPLSLVIAQGLESLRDWVEYPSDPKRVLSWKIIYGSGNISQEIIESDTYYVAVGNLNSEIVTVPLNITIWSVLYNISEAHFQCSLSKYGCSFKLRLLGPNAAVLTSPGAGQVKGNEDWYIKVSYTPRWLTYLGGSCIMTALILLLFMLTNIIQPNNGYQAGNRATQTGARDPLLSPKSDDGLSDGSSYESVSHDEDDLEERLLDGSPEGKVTNEGEGKDSPRRLCFICYNAPRDCFFLPCGHCAACFACGTRTGDEAGICPMCRRKTKKVRKIFTV